MWASATKPERLALHHGQFVEEIKFKSMRSVNTIYEEQETNFNRIRKTIWINEAGLWLFIGRIFFFQLFPDMSSMSTFTPAWVRSSLNVEIFDNKRGTDDQSLYVFTFK